MTTDARSLFERAASHGALYRESVASGSARPTLDYHGMRERLTAPTPETGTDAATIIEQLVDLATPGLMPTIAVESSVPGQMDCLVFTYRRTARAKDDPIPLIPAPG